MKRTGTKMIIFSPKGLPGIFLVLQLVTLWLIGGMRVEEERGCRKVTMFGYPPQKLPEADAVQVRLGTGALP